MMVFFEVMRQRILLEVAQAEAFPVRSLPQTRPSAARPGVFGPRADRRRHGGAAGPLAGRPHDPRPDPPPNPGRNTPPPDPRLDPPQLPPPQSFER